MPPLNHQPSQRGRRAAIVLVIGLLALLTITATAGASGLLTPEQVARLFGPAPTAQPPAAPPPAPPQTALLPAQVQFSGAKPEAGWLYVVDTNRLATTSQILLISPEDGAIKAVYHAGYHPEIAVAPDGTRLYVLSNAGSLETIDPSTGQVLSTATVPDRIMTTAQPTGPTMRLSPDGSILYILTMRIVSPGNDAFALRAYSTSRQRFLPQEIALPSCGMGQLLPFDGGVQVACTLTNDIRSVSFDQAGGPTKQIGIPAQSAQDPAQASLSHIAVATQAASGNQLFVLTGDGRVLTVDRASSQIVATHQISLPKGSWVPGGLMAQGAGQGELFVGVGPLSSRSQRIADRVIAVDPATGQGREVFQGGTFWSLAAGDDGQRLYATSLDQQSVTVIDPASGSTLRVLEGLGASPAYVVVAP